VVAYVIAEVEVFDASVVKEYRELSRAAIAEYGGQYVARNVEARALEGDWPTGHRIVVLAFADTATAHAWYASPGYREARAVADRGMRRRMAVVQGESPVSGELL
jgi:uncharacterized protein (DUF1330 family)